MPTAAAGAAMSWAVRRQAQVQMANALPTVAAGAAMSQAAINLA